MGETADIVNSGVTLIHLVANHAGNHVASGQYANGLPVGQDGSGLSGWQEKGVDWAIKQRSDWYEFWNADMEFKVGMRWNHSGSLHGVGKYVDQITVVLNVEYLPADFTLDVTASFPPHGLNYGSDDEPIGGLAFTIAVELRGVLGQVVAWTKNLDCSVRGDGTWTMA